MVVNGLWNGVKITFSLKPQSITVGFDHPDNSSVFSFDLEGRLWAAMKDGISYRRGLNGKIIARWLEGPCGSQRRWLSDQESWNLMAEINKKIILLSNAAEDDVSLTTSQPLDENMKIYLKKAALFSPEAAHDDACRFYRVYKPVGILPPDQYMAVVIQMTEGCSYNQCSFCSFYKDWVFHIKTEEELRTHVNGVVDFLGDGIKLRRTIFLGDANSLVIPQHLLIPRLQMVNRLLPVAQLGGIFAFLDGFSAERKTVEDYRLLSQLGIKRIYIGMESGCRALLEFLEKPGSPEDVLHAVISMKNGGISVGIIVLLGAGGKRFSKSHIKETIEIINKMNLDMDDLIYFSELVTDEHMPYVQKAFQVDLAPLSPLEIAQQMQVMESGFKFSTAGGKPHISRYDIREFVY